MPVYLSGCCHWFVEETMKTYTQTEVDALVSATWDQALSAVRELERQWRRWAVSECNPLVKPTDGAEEEREAIHADVAVGGFAERIRARGAKP